jgi:hypothetical protein
MHSTDLPSGITVFHDGDFDGDVVFVLSYDAVTDTMGGDASDGFEVTVPFTDILELVFEYIKTRRIRDLEEITATEFIEGLI